MRYLDGQQPAHRVLAAKLQEHPPELGHPGRMLVTATNEMILHRIAFDQRVTTGKSMDNALQLELIDNTDLRVEAANGSVEREAGESEGTFEVDGRELARKQLEIASKLRQLAEPLLKQPVNRRGPASALENLQSTEKMAMQLVLIDAARRCIGGRCALELFEVCAQVLLELHADDDSG